MPVIFLLGQRDPREIINFTFSILSNQSDCIPSEILPSLFTRCYQYAMILGLEEEVKDDPTSVVVALTDSVVCSHYVIIQYHNALFFVVVVHIYTLQSLGVSKSSRF